MTHEEPFGLAATGRTVVVAAASRHGSTDEIADRVAGRLRRVLPANWSVARTDLANSWSLVDADAVVLGSAVYFGRWLRPARRALRRIEGCKNVWLFSSGPVLPDDSPPTPLVDGHRHTTFGGRLDPTRLSVMERTVTRFVHAEPGDRRDWTAIDDWADDIGHELTRTFENDHTTGARS
jgi:menaquinone-dependent protoporphyrinogen oxidase